MSYINAILFNKQRGIVTLSDVLVLAVKEFLGKTKYDEGAATSTGDVATLTASTGKDMYFAKGQVNFKSTSATGALVHARWN